MPKIVESDKANIYQVSVKVSSNLIKQIEGIATSKNITRSEVVRQAIISKLNE